MLKHINQISEQAFILDFGSEINMEINNFVLSFTDYIYSQIEKSNFLEIKNCVPSYNKILIQFDPLSDSKSKILDFIYSINQKDIPSIINKKTIEIPICYDNEFALDLADVAAFGRCTQEEVIRIHANLTYRVYMLGFQPGFAYLGSVNAEIASPRRETPRIKVPAGSVGIAGRQTGVYPCDSPGGWQIIGRCPIALVDWNSETPFILRPGDRVKFKPIDRTTYDVLLAESR